MALTSTHLDVVDSFRTTMEEGLAGDPRFAKPERVDRPDGAMLATRWASVENPRVWFEIAVRPGIPQVRVGVLTDDRWKSEDFEEKIEESGDTMGEFVEMGFDEADLTWKDPIVEHFREDMKYFYFATSLDLGAVDELSSGATRGKIRKMMDGYFHAFGAFLK
jgi:hypothetical protein